MKKWHEILGKPGEALELKNIRTVFQIPSGCPGVVIVTRGVVEISNINGRLFENLRIEETRCPTIVDLNIPQLDGRCNVHSGFCPALTPVDKVVVNRKGVQR